MLLARSHDAAAVSIGLASGPPCGLQSVQALKIPALQLTEIAVTNNFEITTADAAQPEQQSGANIQGMTPQPSTSAEAIHKKHGRRALTPTPDNKAAMPHPLTVKGSIPSSKVTSALGGGTKTEAVLKKLRSTKGATIRSISDATGWQAHSVRGFLSGTVKKKLGLNLVSEAAKDGIRRYRIVPVTQSA